MRISDWSSDVCSSDLVALPYNPVDAVWRDRPQPSNARLIVHADRHAGKSSAQKRQEMAEWLKEKRADAAVLSALDSRAWTPNIRGQERARTPVGLALLLVTEGERAVGRVEGAESREWSASGGT